MPTRLAATSILVFCSLALTGSAEGVAAQTLTAAERKMQTYVRDHAAEQVAFLEKVVNINSGTMNHAGVRAVGDAFAAELKSLGFETRWVSLPPEMKRAGHLFAEHKAKRGRNTGKTVLLLGHLDTVFEGEGQKFTKINDSTAKGAGTADMKG